MIKRQNKSTNFSWVTWVHRYKLSSSPFLPHNLQQHGTPQSYSSSHNHGSVENGCISKTNSLLVGPFHFHHHGRVTSPFFSAQLCSQPWPLVIRGETPHRLFPALLNLKFHPTKNGKKAGNWEWTIRTHPKTLWESDYFRYGFCWCVNHIFSGGVWVSRGRKQNIRAKTGSWWLGWGWLEHEMFKDLENFRRWNGWDVK